MKIVKATDLHDMSRKAANIISAQVILHPQSVLGLATGSSPIGTYQQLVEWYKKGDLDFSEVKTINLDEYVGLDGTDEQSYRYYMNHHLFNHVNAHLENTFVPNGKATNLEAECARYDNLIASLGGIDLQLLGLGHNGHIGFNEPSTAFEKTTHCVTLGERTIQANARFFGSEENVPRQAITMGIKSIMLAKSILLIVSGEDKRDILHQALYGPVTPNIPASILQLHPNLTVVSCNAL